MSAHPQAGISRVQMTIGLLVSFILILGFTALFINTSMPRRAHSELARIQEDARHAMALLGEDARRVGIQACISADHSAADKSIGIENAVKLSSDGSILILKYVEPSTCGSSTPKITTAVYWFGYNGSRLHRFQSEEPLTISNILDQAQYPMPLVDNVDGAFTLLPEGSSPEAANAVQITINTPSDKASNEVRSFSSTYEFKHRVIRADVES